MKYYGDCFICLLGLMFTSQSTTFESCWVVSWVEPVLSRSFAQGYNTGPLTRLVGATPQS